MSELYAHEETGNNPVTLVQQSHSLEPAVLDQCSRSVHGDPVTDETSSGKGLELCASGPTVTAFGLPPYHHHACIHVCCGCFLYSAVSSNTEFNTTHRSTSRSYFLKKNRQSCSMAYTKQRQLIPASHVVAEPETDTVEPNKSLQALMHPPPLHTRSIACLLSSSISQ